MNRETVHAVRLPDGGMEITAGPVSVRVVDATVDLLRTAAEQLVETAARFSIDDVMLAAYRATQE